MRPTPFKNRPNSGIAPNLVTLVGSYSKQVSER